MKKIILTYFISVLSLSAQNVTTYSGSGGQGHNDGNAMSATFNWPQDICADQEGNFYVADGFNGIIRKITSSGDVTTFAGVYGNAFSDGPAVSAGFGIVSGIAIDGIGNLYVADINNHKIRKITPSGDVSTLAGSTAGYADGNGSAAKFNSPRGVCVDPLGNVYVADYDNDKIRKISPNGDVTTVAGSVSGYADGASTTAQFAHPTKLCIDPLGNIYVCDAFNGKIRKIDMLGNVTTVGDGFYYPEGICSDSEGNIFISDSGNNRIKKMTTSGEIITIAGSTGGFADGPALSAKFSIPLGICMDSNSNIFVVDKNNQKIREISSTLGTNDSATRDFQIVYNSDLNLVTVTIEAGQINSDTKLNICDMIGKVIFCKLIVNQTTTINLDGYSKGLHLFVLTNGYKKTTKKVVIR